MNIDRCACFGKTFAELQAVARDRGVRDATALQAHVTFGRQCRLCLPYVRRMLATGETVFHEIVVDEGPGRQLS